MIVYSCAQIRTQPRSKCAYHEAILPAHDEQDTTCNKIPSDIRRSYHKGKQRLVRQSNFRPLNRHQGDASVTGQLLLGVAGEVSFIYTICCIDNLYFPSWLPLSTRLDHALPQPQLTPLTMSY